ncbi:MAG: Primosomal protein N' [Chlamydiia bacterium]|nr:Primosomal protein N' [Chlamydiia bacterium]
MIETEKKLFATIIVDQAVGKPLDYAIPTSLHSAIEPGMRVVIPLRKKQIKGTVISLHPTSEVENPSEVIELLEDGGRIPEHLFSLMKWISDYYGSDLRKTIMMMIPRSVRDEVQQKKQLMICLKKSPKELTEIAADIRSRFPKQASVLDVLLQNTKGLLLTELVQKAGVTKAPIDTLIKKELITSKQVIIDNSELESDEFFQTAPKTLNDEQAAAFKKITATIDQEIYQTHLIHGVTGSGKTEIYLQAIDHVLKKGKSVIMLVPEIALTRQTIERFKSRFTQPIAVLHHRLSKGERFDAWQKIRTGDIKIIIGARSAIFSPAKDLGLIIVDEEQDSSYKQKDDMPCYHGRDVAIMRGAMTKSCVILGSATPSIETFYNAKNDKYQLSTLSVRAGNAKLPKVDIIDMGIEYDKNKGPTLFSDKLLSGIERRIEDGEQILLFLNRRGFYTSHVCTSCNEPIKCKHCDVSLTYHKNDHLLSCHVCGYSIQGVLEKCPTCGSKETMKFRGPGTEHVERALHKIFPQVRTLRMDRDTTKHKGSHDRIFREFRSGKADVLIGTQMIAKGLHFPNVTLAALINADSSLHIPDFRSGETVFQLTAQVAGRAGRGVLPGEVIIQTLLPHHTVFKHAATEDYLNFYKEEIQERKLFGYPPFSHLARFQISGYNEKRAEKFAHQLRTHLIKTLPKTCDILPIAPCGHAKIKDKFRFQFLLRSPQIAGLGKYLNTLMAHIKKPSGTYLLIDIDPHSTF